jgi:large subunit ribosomal protein L35
MPTLKTVKGLTRRFKLTATGKLMGSRAGRRHLLRGKSAKKKRHLRRPKLLSEHDARSLRLLVPSR